MNQLCALYRHFDADGRLLYVGISKHTMRRLAEHGDSRWAHDIASVTLEHFSSREEASEAEKQAIRAECPVYNRLRFGAPKPETAEALPDDRISQEHYDGVRAVLDLKGSECCFSIDIASWIMDVPVPVLDAMVDVPAGHIPRIATDEMYVLLDRLRDGPKPHDVPIPLRKHIGEPAHSGKGVWGAQLPADEWLVRRPTPSVSSEGPA
jgi:predicted GIY-YIG superfamily endonuclease